jgi:hypothetical protein
MKYKIVLIFVFVVFEILYADEHRWVKEHHIVKDSHLNLIWQDAVNVKYRKRSWSNANKYCENLTLTKRTEWRLPTLPELLSTIDYSKSSPALVEAFSFSSASGYYWTASTISTDNRYAWYIAIDKGNTYAYSKAEKVLFRCVHDDK